MEAKGVNDHALILTPTDLDTPLWDRVVWGQIP